MAERENENNSTPRLDEPRALRSEEHSSALKLINSTLRPNGPRTILKEYPLVLGKKNIENMRVIVEGGEVLSHAAIYFSKLRSGDLVFTVGGINSVATDVAYRGRGLGSEVMRDCIKVMRDSSCHLSILWTQRHGFYRNLGYETAGSSRLFKARARQFSHVPRDCKIISYSPRYMPGIIEIHNRENLRTERTAKEYETYFALPKTRALLAVRGKTVSAYAVMGKGEDLRNCIHDWGGDPRDLLALVRKLASLASTGEIMILAPAGQREFTRLLDQMRIPSASEYLAMMKVIDVEGLSSVLGDNLSGKLGMDFQILRSGSGFRIKVGREEAAMEQERNLVRLLFGPDAASNILTGISRETLRALDRALPIPLFIWGLDSV